MSQIRMDYEEMAASSQTFLQMSQQADEMVKRVKTEADKLSAGWEGVADVEFLGQIDSCMTRLQHPAHDERDLKGDQGGERPGAARRGRGQGADRQHRRRRHELTVFQTHA